MNKSNLGRKGVIWFILSCHGKLLKELRTRSQIVQEPGYRWRGHGGAQSQLNQRRTKLQQYTSLSVQYLVFTPGCLGSPKGSWSLPWNMQNLSSWLRLADFLCGLPILLVSPICWGTFLQLVWSFTNSLSWVFFWNSSPDIQCQASVALNDPFMPWTQKNLGDPYTRKLSFQHNVQPLLPLKHNFHELTLKNRISEGFTSMILVSS